MKNIFLITLLIFFTCDNPIDINSSQELESDDTCNLHASEMICFDNDSCQWINNECVTSTASLCTLNYGGVIDDCGFCASGTTGIIYNKDKNICGECFLDNPSDPSMLVFYDHDDNIETPELFCGCEDYNSSTLNDGCCGIIGSYNFFRDNNNNECDPDNNESNSCTNITQRDECGICAGGGIDEWACDCDGNIIDCLGNCAGDATIDNCGTCDDDIDNDCVQDCAEIWGGSALEDNCGTCDSDTLNDCVQDCSGIWGGSTLIDDCGVCDGSGFDCNGECNEAVYDCTFDSENESTWSSSCGGNEISCFGCTNIYAENYAENATIDDGSCIESSVTLFPDFSSILLTDVFGNALGSTGVYYSECYNQNLYNNDRANIWEGTPLADGFSNLYPNPFDYKSSINVNIEESSEFDLFIIDATNTVIEILHEGYISSGDYLFTWDGSSNELLLADGHYRIIADFGDWECFQNIKFEDNLISCEDNNACNYDPYHANATIDNTSCLYDDCAGICGGNTELDCAGICDGDAVEDCEGVCEGNAVVTCGVCNGPEIPEGECDCNGNVLDECDVCGGTGIPEGDCDCYGNILDCQLVCGGDAEIDDCGICNGLNVNKDMCNICYGNNTTCTQGILTLNDWHFDYKSIWNNNECSGPIHYDTFNYICLEDVCYDYKLTFNNDYTFQFLIEYWDMDSDCDWLLDSDNCNPNYDFSNIGSWYMSINQTSPLLINGDLLCLDYENEELEDFCFDSIELLNNYEDCIIDIEACNNNILYLSLSNNNQCYTEQYSTENYINNNSSNSTIDFNNLSIINQNIINSILNVSLEE